jgi:hypothetical protein
MVLLLLHPDDKRTVRNHWYDSRHSDSIQHPPYWKYYGSSATRTAEVVKPRPCPNIPCPAQRHITPFSIDQFQSLLTSSRARTLGDCLFRFLLAASLANICCLPVAGCSWWHPSRPSRPSRAAVQPHQHCTILRSLTNSL